MYTTQYIYSCLIIFDVSGCPLDNFLSFCGMTHVQVNKGAYLSFQ